MLYSNDWWRIHMAEGKLRCRSTAWRPPRTSGRQSRPIVCLRDILHILKQAVLSTQKRKQHAQTHCSQLLVMDGSQRWLKIGKTIYLLRLINCCLSPIIYIQTFVMEIV